jgi:hypothetical protein
MVWKTCGNSSNYERIKFLSGAQDRIAGWAQEKSGLAEKNGDIGMDSHLMAMIPMNRILSNKG